MSPRIKMFKPRIATIDTRCIKPPPKTVDAIYTTPQYREWRELVIARAGDRCEWPGCCRGGRLYADHRHELKDGGAPFDPENGWALCAVHHGRKSAAERTRRAGL